MELKVYLDGANIAHENHKMIRASRIIAAIDEIRKHGFEPHVLLPNYLVKKVVDPEIVKKLVNDGQLSLISNDDDEALITRAYEKDAFIITNDRFEDHKKKDWWSSKIGEWIKLKLITYEFIEGDFSIPMSMQHRLEKYLKKSPTPHMSVSDFKKYATNGGILSDTPIKALPEPVQKMLKSIQKMPDEKTLAALGSQLKSTTGCKLNDLFGNGINAARFLESQGFPVRNDNKNNFYVKGATA